MSDTPPRPSSRAPLFVALGCLTATLLGGCVVLGLLLLGAAVAVEADASPAAPTGAAPGTPPATTPAPAAGDVDATLRWSLPSGWTEEANGWLVRRVADPLRPEARLAAHARVLAPLPAEGDMGAVLRQAWSTGAPPELRERAGGMVYRRWVGDGLPAFFLTGAGREQGRQADTLCSVFLIDCGPTWTPLVVAQTYENPSEVTQAFVEMAAGFSWGQSAALAEELLANLRCPAGKGRPLVSQEALVGHYYYGSGSALQWENVNTGATTMTTVSYGGELDLRADGSFESKFSSASGQVGQLQFGSENQSGRWRVEGDLLVLAADQGGERRRRVAGLTQFQDAKVLLLLLDLDRPVNATTVQEPGSLYSTRKRD